MTRKVLSAWLRVLQASSCSGEAEVIGRGFRKEANDFAARMQPAASSLDRIA